MYNIQVLTRVYCPLFNQPVWSYIAYMHIENFDCGIVCYHVVNGTTYKIETYLFGIGWFLPVTIGYLVMILVADESNYSFPPFLSWARFLSSLFIILFFQCFFNVLCHFVHFFQQFFLDFFIENFFCVSLPWYKCALWSSKRKWSN